MKQKVALFLIVLGLFLLPLVVGAEDGKGPWLLAEGESGGEGEGSLSFIDYTIFVMIIFVVIYFGALFFQEWKRVR